LLAVTSVVAKLHVPAGAITDRTTEDLTKRRRKAWDLGTGLRVDQNQVVPSLPISQWAMRCRGSGRLRRGGFGGFGGLHSACLSHAPITFSDPRAVFGATTGSILLGRVPSTRRWAHWVGPWPHSTSNNHRYTDAANNHRSVGSDVHATDLRMSRVRLLQAADVAKN
ncbi:hypothetical protein THAOC_23225, partial [Thalassiosira oceanica]